MVCFAATGFALIPERLEPWLLQYGEGLNPLEWIPAAFAHGGFMHLIGNMFFLWGFGLVVEGKLGWKRFLPLYFAMAAAWGAGVDLLTLYRTDEYVLSHDVGDLGVKNFEQFEAGWDEEEFGIDARTALNIVKGRCLGASGVIFALMAISLVWAPKNEMHIVGYVGVLYFYRGVSFDVSIMTYSLWYLGLSLLGYVVSGGEMGSSGLHVVGAVVGFGVGVLYVKLRWIDCENWDLFSVMSGKYGRFAEKDWALGGYSPTGKTYSEIPLPTGAVDDDTQFVTKARTRKVSGAMKGVNGLIDAGDVLTAAEELMTMRLHETNICPDEARTKKLAMGLLQAQAYDDAEIWLQEYIDSYPHDNAWARIRMSQLLLTQLKRPTAALKTLKGLSLEGVDQNLQNLAKKIVRTAKVQVRSGVQDEEPEW